MLTKIKIDYSGQQVDAILLAKITIKREIYAKSKLFRCKKKKLLMDKDFTDYCLVYIPWKNRNKEITIVGCGLILNDKLEFANKDNIIKVENFETTYDNGLNYYKNYVKSFEGYSFLFNNKDFIDKMHLFEFEKVLNSLFEEIPEVLLEEFNDDEIINNMFVPFQKAKGPACVPGSTYLEFQYCEKENIKNYYKKIEYNKLNSLYVSVNSLEHFLNLYHRFFDPDNTHVFDVFGVNYYTKQQAKNIYKSIDEANVKGSKELLIWLQKAFEHYNGFYILGI